MKNILLFALVLITKFGIAQKEPIEKIWWSEEKTSKIQIYKASDGYFYGKIIYLQTPNDKNGHPRVDNKNPDDKLKSTPVLNLVILKKFKKSTEPNVYEEGTVYDPHSGKTYCGKLTLTEKSLKLRGFICSFSWFGRTSVWTLAE